MEAVCPVAGRPVESTHIFDRNQNELLAMAYRMVASSDHIPNGAESADVLTAPGDSSQSFLTER